MNVKKIWRTTAVAIILSAGLSLPAYSAARSVAPSDVATHNGIDEFSARAHGGGGRGGGGGGRAHARGGGGGRTNVNVSNRSRSRTNVNVSKRTNVNVNAGRRTNVVVGGGRPVRGFAYRPYYGRIIGGVALGTMIGVAVVGTAPVAPAPNMCWFWSDSVYSQGYWDYCTPPAY